MPSVATRSTWYTDPTTGSRVEAATVTFDGRDFTASGGLVSPTLAIGYPTVDAGTGELHAFDGTVLGTVRVTGAARGFGARLVCYRAVIDGRVYHGRGLGRGMLLRLRRRAPAA